ncbi:1908_t:CDS:2 [Entrophospora sp. SA101]|nr:1908_t:CDS:2 [Entrophospora sp. SA101]
MSPDQVVLKIAKNVQPKDLTAIIAIDGMRSAAICNQRAFLPISPLSPPKRQGMPVFVDNNLIDILVSDMPSLKAKLPSICQKLFEGKNAKKITFNDIAEKLGRDEVWVAAAKPDEDDLKKLSVILDIKESYLIDDLDKSYFPTRGGLINMPPSDPFLYRFYEILQVYGYPLKSIVNEKFGDGIMSAIDFTANVDKVKKEDQERVKITFEGKFLPYKKW